MVASVGVSKESPRFLLRATVSPETRSGFLDLLRQAASSRFGLAIKTPNRSALRRLLFEAKRDVKELDDLTVTLSPISQDELLIIKKEVYDRGRVQEAALRIEEGDDHADGGGSPETEGSLP